MKQSIKAGEAVSFRGIRCVLLSDIEVEADVDLRSVDVLADTDAAVEKAQKDLFHKDA